MKPFPWRNPSLWHIETAKCIKAINHKYPFGVWCWKHRLYVKEESDVL